MKCIHHRKGGKEHLQSFEIKIVLFIINFTLNYGAHYEQVQVKNRASLSKGFVLFN